MESYFCGIGARGPTRQLMLPVSPRQDVALAHCPTEDLRGGRYDIARAEFGHSATGRAVAHTAFIANSLIRGGQDFTKQSQWFFLWSHFGRKRENTM